jgi:hypothetical protein
MLSKSISQEMEVQRSMDLLKSITNGSQAALLQKKSLQSFAVTENEQLRKETGEESSTPLPLDRLEKEALSS